MDWLALAAMLGLVGIVRISLWQYLGSYDYGEHWMRDHWCVLGGIKPALLTAAGVAPNVPPSC
jgi:hypothetical protein